MNALSIRHTTTYRYREPVRLGRIGLCCGPAKATFCAYCRVRSSCPPAASVSRTNDVFGNAVATASFSGPANGLNIENLIVDLERSAAYFQIVNLQQIYVS